MKKILLSIIAWMCIALPGQAQTVTFSARNPAAGVIEIYGTYGSAAAYTFISGISSFSMTFEYPRTEANGGASFANAAAVTAWNNTFKSSIVYNTTYFTGGSSAGTMGDGNGTPGATFTALNASTYLSTNVASSGLQSIPGTDFPLNTPVLLATIVLPSGLAVSSITMKDWANNRAYGSGSPLYAWYIAFDGAGMENVATIFSQTATTNTPVNSGAANATSYMAFTGSPLPVKLLSFYAKKAETRSQLNWQTTGETSTAYFEVERSLDGKNFNTVIRRMPAAGNSTTQRDYQTYDNSPEKGVNYYRLKMVDGNGSYSYSSVRNVTFHPAGHLYTLTPNPAKDFIVVSGMTAGASIMILSTSGQVISSTKATGTAETINLNVVPGMYYVQIVQDGNLLYSTKFTKQ